MEKSQNDGRRCISEPGQTENGPGFWSAGGFVPEKEEPAVLEQPSGDGGGDVGVHP